jgi:hypothetical protein
MSFPQHSSSARQCSQSGACILISDCNWHNQRLKIMTRTVRLFRRGHTSGFWEISPVRMSLTVKKLSLALRT